jgi:tetratricopeptide (TPR) repeat protein
MLASGRRARAMQVISVRGGPGVGKNRLADWLMARAHECGAAEVIAVSHAPVESPDQGMERALAESFRVVGLSADAIEERIGERLRYEGVDDSYEWRALTGLLCDGARGVALQNPLQRYALFERHLMRVARERPVLLWLRDVHYGAESLRFVRYMLSRREQLTRPIVVVTTARDDILAERGAERELLEEIEAAPVGVATLELEPLSEVDCASLLYQHFGLAGGLARRVARRVGGSPMFAIELVGSWLQRGDLEPGVEGFGLREGASAAFPDELFRIWSERVNLLLEGFPQAARRALWLAAALGRQVVTRELQRASALARVSFSQRLLDELYSAREQGEWARLNDACATTLLELYGAQGPRYAERMAGHLIEAGRAAEALEYLFEAAEAKLGSGDFFRAHELLEAMREQLDVAGLGAGDARRGKVLALTARCLGLSWSLDEALEAARALHRGAVAHGWAELEAEALYMLAHGARQRGAHDEASELAARARPLFAALSDREGLARVVQLEADLAAARNEPERAIELYGEALEAFEALGEVGRAADCLMACGHVHRGRHRLREAETFYRDALARYRREGTDHKIANCVNALAELFRFEGELERAHLNYERAHKIYVAIGSRQAFIPRLNMGLIEVARGDAAAARELFVHGEAVCRAYGLTSFLVYPLLGLAACAAMEGDADAYDARWREALAARGERARDPDTGALAEGGRDPDVAILAERAGDAWAARGDLKRARGAWAYALAERRALGHGFHVESLGGKIEGSGVPGKELP